MDGRKPKGELGLSFDKHLLSNGCREANVTRPREKKGGVVKTNGKIDPFHGGGA